MFTSVRVGYLEFLGSRCLSLWDLVSASRGSPRTLGPGLSAEKVLKANLLIGVRTLWWPRSQRNLEQVPALALARSHTLWTTVSLGNGLVMSAALPPFPEGFKDWRSHPPRLESPGRHSLAVVTSWLSLGRCEAAKGRSHGAGLSPTT